MDSLNEISAERVASSDAVTVDIRQPISKIKQRMEEHDLREIPVTDGKKFKGMISYRNIVKKLGSDPSSTNAESVMHQPPEARPEMNLVELASLRKNSGRKRFVLQDGDRLKAVVGEEEIVYPLAEGANELRKIRVEDLMTRDIITHTEDEKHSHLVKTMREHGISRFPIVDANGKLTGIVTSHDVLRFMTPREQMNEGDVKGYKNEISEIPCRELMDPNVFTVQDPALQVTDLIGQMKRENVREAIVTDDDGRPQAIMTLRDIIEFISSFEEQEAVMVNLINVDDPGEKQQIHDKFETAIKGKLGKVVKPREITLHVKRYEEEGSQKKYSLKAKMFSDLGTTIVDKHGWSLLDAVDEVIDQLKERAGQEKEQRRDRARKGRRSEKQQ